MFKAKVAGWDNSNGAPKFYFYNGNLHNGYSYKSAYKAKRVKIKEFKTFTFFVYFNEEDGVWHGCEASTGIKLVEGVKMAEARSELKELLAECNDEYELARDIAKCSFSTEPAPGWRMPELLNELMAERTANKANNDAVKNVDNKERAKFLKEPAKELVGKQKRMVDAAAMVLAKAIEPMTAETIMDAVFKQDLYELPYAVNNPARGLNSVIGREILTKGNDSRFVMVEKNTYAYAG